MVERRYETLSILNDFAIGVWFLLGSALFFFKPLGTWAIGCFVLGSLQFLARPSIRLHRRIYLKGRREGDYDEGHDY